jgi:hypothetical protein
MNTMPASYTPTTTPNVVARIRATLERGGFEYHRVPGLSATRVLGPQGLNRLWTLTYANTEVATIGEWYVWFYAGGFYTATTCRRMNQALQAAGLVGWRVNRVKGSYVVTSPGRAPVRFSPDRESEMIRR